MAIFFLHFWGSSVWAQIGGIPGVGPGPCACAPSYGSRCCGCAQAESCTDYYTNTDPNGCTCVWQSSSCSGNCSATGHSACACDGGGSYTGGGGGFGGGGSGGGGGCSPNCGGSACGQSDGCGGSCSNSDNGAPSTPIISSPTDGGQAIMNPTTLQVAVNWNNTNKADRYNIQVFPEGTSCADPDAHCVNTTSSQYSFVPTKEAYQVRVRAQNTDCGTDSSTWTTYTFFEVHAPVSGTVYLDNDNTASLTGNACSTGSALRTLQAGVSEVTLHQNGQYFSSGLLNSNGTYQATAPYWVPGNNILQLNIGESSLYTCTCPAGCVYSGINSPQSGVNYYLIEARDSWFQIEGGPITAFQTTGTAIRNYVSDKCSEDPDCRPYLITQNNTIAISSGYIMTGGGAVDLQYIPGNQITNIDEDGRNIVVTVDRKVAQERYEYFFRLYDFPENPENDFSPLSLSVSKPVAPPINSGVNAYYQSGDLFISEEWSVANGEKIVVFIDGDVTVANQIQVEVGGFLAIISSGNILIDSNVGHTDLTDSSGLVEGVFVANGQIVLPSRGAASGGDLKFVGEGSFVGWQGIVLERDYDNQAGRKVENNTKPTEVFRYRPDFLLYAPEEIRVPRYVWREVAP